MRTGSVARPDGARLYVEVHGEPGDEPLVLLEGMGGDIPGWGRTIPRLAAEHLVVAYDHRGNGRSIAPDGPATMDTFVEDCLAVMDAFGIERAHVYGQSFGGMVAIELGLAHPGRVRSLVLAATHAGSAHAVPGRGRAPKDRPWLQLYAPSFAAAYPDRVEEEQRAARRRPRHPEGERRQCEAVRAWDAWDRLGELRMPVLVLHGDEDQLIDVANARALAERIPRAELAIIEGAGHVYHAERPELTERLALDFLRRHRG
ncbi:MAG: alpha/beta hydrolase [Actinomycetota bacterium]|nr:MAG: alpha/beta hydrolase [Actinomycetota bacterium]